MTKDRSESIDLDAATYSLIAHARAHIAVERESFALDIDVALLAIAQRLNGRMLMQRALRDADDDTREMVRSLINSSVFKLETDSREAMRVGERVAHPVQTATIAGTFALAIAALAGTITVPIALIYGSVTLVTALYTSWVRSRMARRESLLKGRADKIRALL